MHQLMSVIPSCYYYIALYPVKGYYMLLRFDLNVLIPAVVNQIYLVTLRPTQLTQASFLQKNQTLQNVFFYICNAEMAQSLSSLQKSESLKLIILIFHVKKINNWCELHVRLISCNF